MNNNKAQPEKQQQKAMALEFNNFFSFLLFCLFIFISFLYYMKNCFLPAGTLHFWKLGE